MNYSLFSYAASAVKIVKTFAGKACFDCVFKAYLKLEMGGEVVS